MNRTFLRLAGSVLVAADRWTIMPDGVYGLRLFLAAHALGLSRVDVPPTIDSFEATLADREFWRRYQRSLAVVLAPILFRVARVGAGTGVRLAQQTVQKANPYHDARGRFTSGGGGGELAAGVPIEVATRWVRFSDDVTATDRATIETAALTGTTKATTLERLSYDDPGLKVGDVLTWKGPVSFTAEEFTKGADAGVITPKVSDKAIYRIQRPRHGFDVEYEGLGASSMMIKERETVVAGRYTVSRVTRKDVIVMDDKRERYLGPRSFPVYHLQEVSQ